MLQTKNITQKIAPTKNQYKLWKFYRTVLSHQCNVVNLEYFWRVRICVVIGICLPSHANNSLWGQKVKYQDIEFKQS